jgi:NAD(P)-dependent dehydrogenase (short-subunit alcohol dehydrogenase family)
LINIIQNEYKNIDILINNAGKLVNKPFEDISRNDLYSVFDVNVFGVFNLIQKLLPYFKKKSHVVNISSVGGLVGSSKFPGLTAYSSSKGALNILTEVLAEEFAESGPKFNSLSLGSVNTPMLKEAFPGYSAKVTPDEMASFIFNFANTASSIFNGKVIPVSSTNP